MLRHRSNSGFGRSRVHAMPGQVYIFERGLARATDSTPLSDTMNAITMAASGSADIRYELLTPEANPKPMVTVVFSDVAAMEAFAARLDDAIALWNIRIATVHTVANL
jgi:hypothetical protein